jgi:glyoxylase I family protein
MSIEVKDVVTLISVYDMPRALRFYRDGLGFSVLNTSQPGDDCGWAMLRLGEATLMLNTAYDPGTRPSEPDPARIESHRDTILYFACPDPDGCHRYLSSKGIHAERPGNAFYGMRQVHLTDPDGYMLCFQWPVASGPKSE